MPAMGRAGQHLEIIPEAPSTNFHTGPVPILRCRKAADTAQA